jgi:hypothetical protein
MIGRRGGLVAALLALVGGVAATAFLAAHSGGGTAATARGPWRAELSALTRPRGLEQSRQARLARGGEADRGGSGPTAAEQAYADRALPRTAIGYAQVVRSRAAQRRVAQRGAALRARALASRRVAAAAPTWHLAGPSTLDVDTLGTQTFNRPTQWSGRVTSLVRGPGCSASHCRAYLGAAGGGVWVTPNILAGRVSWSFTSSTIPSTSIGSLLVDPTDRSGRTVYAGTGEPNGSGDSEAGIGLYISHDRGLHWALVPGSLPIAKDRGIGAIAIDPRNARHILLGTDVARHGLSATQGGRFTPPGAPPIGLYESFDGGATFRAADIRPQDAVDPTTPNGSDFFRGGVTKIQFDPSDRNVVYYSMFGYGLIRRTGGAKQLIFVTSDPQNVFAIRYEFAAVTLRGKTRIYLGEGSDEVADPKTGALTDASKLYRVDDARQPAAKLTNGTTNPGWTLLSSPDPSQAGFASFDFCQAQCSYDIFVESPPGHPSTVYIGGAMQYGELPIYAGADPSDGRAVMRSVDGGRTFTDMTGDNRVAFEDMHPDQHAILFVPGNQDRFVVGSDGGVIRSSGKLADGTWACAGRSLTGADLTNCHRWLKAIPTNLQVINAGLSTLQFQGIAVNPSKPLLDLFGGTQDNGTMGTTTGSTTWTNFVTGDGGTVGIDAADHAIRYHTYADAFADVNFHGFDPARWDFIFDKPFLSGEASSFYLPLVADPTVGGSLFAGLQHVWRTQDHGGPRAFLDAHCNTDFGDQILTGACGDLAPIGPDLTGTTFGTDKGGDFIASISRAPSNASTMWVGTRRGRIFVSKNANAANPAAASFTRIDTPQQPQRFPSSISVDPLNPNHAFVSFSGYNAYTPATPGHVFEVFFNGQTGAATWIDRSFDLGDQPITSVAYDRATGDVYAATDWGVDVRRHGSAHWVPAAAGLPRVAVYDLKLLPLRSGKRVLYAGTHGRSVYRLIVG